MLPGRYALGPLIDARLRVFVDGVERKHVSAEWEGHTGGGLPESLIAAGDGVFSRTGTIRWAPETATVSSPFAPAGETRWTPTPGAKVRIVAEINGVSFPRFTGYLGTSTFSLTSDEVETSITDGLSAALQTPVTLEPAAWTNEGGATAGWVAYRALEQAGMGILPPVDDSTVIHAPAAFGMYPAVGSFESAKDVRLSSEGYYISPAAVYRPYAPEGRNDMMILACTRAVAGMDAAMSLFIGADVVTLAWENAAKRLVLKINGSETVGTLDVPEPGRNPLLAMNVEYTGIRVWTAPLSSQLFPRRVSWAASLDRATCSNTLGLDVAYLQDIASNPGVRVRDMARAVPARLMPSRVAAESLTATRGFENVAAENVIKDFCEATLSTMWIDEEGRPVLAARDALALANSTTTFEVSEKVLAGSWKTARDGLRGTVHMTYLKPAIDDGRRISSAPGAAAEVYQASQTSPLKQNADNVQFINWEDNVDVVGLDTNYRPVVNAKRKIFDWDAFNSGVGSWWSIAFENNQPPAGWRWTGDAPENETLTGKLEKLGQRGVKLTHRVDVGARNYYRDGHLTYHLRTPSLGTGSLQQWAQGRPMPVLRARQVVTWTKASAKVISARPDAAAYTLDAKWYLTAGDAVKIAKLLAAEVGVERITLDGVQVLWSPQVQVGDTVTITSAGQWSADCIVTGARESWEGRVPTMALDLDVKTTKSLKK